jgi:phosphohistidine phosphatase
MKTIILIRHAKSSWKYDLTDIDRPLSIRGIRDANLLSKELLKYQLNPSGIFSSPANRALTTCKVFMDTLNFPPELLTITDELYDFGGNQVANFIHNLDDSYDDVLIFGHNHAFTAITNNFGDTYVDNVPTCGIVKIQFQTENWKNIDKGHTIMTLFPKHLKS